MFLEHILEGSKGITVGDRLQKNLSDNSGTRVGPYRRGIGKNPC